MLPIIIGTVAITAAGYALKEFCEEEGCPWDTHSASTSSETSNQESKEETDFTKSLAFHKKRKKLYKNSMKEYQEFLNRYEITQDAFSTTQKLEKQKYNDLLIDEEWKSLMLQVEQTLDTLFYNLSLGIKLIKVDDAKKSQDEESLKHLQNYALHIHRLSHINFINDIFPYGGCSLNKTAILLALVEAMSLMTKKDTIHVDLSSELTR